MAHIPLEQLEVMFEKLSAESGWNVSGDLLWGYFFTDPKPKRLKPLAEHLVGLGYRLVSIYETDNRSTYFLHVERVEAHTPKSLFERNAQLNSIASEFGVATYDGMDVGPVAGGTH